MKLSEIVVGTEYAYGRDQEWRRWPDRVEVVEVGLHRQVHGGRSVGLHRSVNADGVRVLKLDRKTGKPNREGTAIVPTSHIRQLWSEFEVDDALRKGRAEAHESEQERRREWLTLKTQAANEALGEDYFGVRNAGLASRKRYEVVVSDGVGLLDAVLAKLKVTGGAD